MRPWAVVPVKCFARGKSRLAAVLDPSQREALARDLCAHVLDVLGEIHELEGVLVMTDCAFVERLASARGAKVVRDDAEGPLSAIVDSALARLARRGVGAALVLMSDLPLLEPRDVRRMLAALEGAPIVIAPDRSSEGTNALGVSPPDFMATCFGTRGSFALHFARARGQGTAAVVHHSEGASLDVDTPGDLAEIERYAERGARVRWKRKRSSRVSAA